jgi:hypothetical protein
VRRRNRCQITSQGHRCLVALLPLSPVQLGRTPRGKEGGVWFILPTCNKRGKKERDQNNRGSSQTTFPDAHRLGTRRKGSPKHALLYKHRQFGQDCVCTPPSCRPERQEQQDLCEERKRRQESGESFDFDGGEKMLGQLFIGAHGTGVPARCVHDHGHSATRKGNVSRCERVLWNNFWAGERVPMRKLSQPQVVMRQGVSGVHHSDAPNNLVLGASFVISNSQSRKGKTDSQSESRCAQIHFSFRC